MAIERTLSIIKPDAVAKNVIGQIYARFEAAGLKVIAARMAHLSRGEADTDWAFESLNTRLRRFHASLEADIVRTLDGKCHLPLLERKTTAFQFFAAEDFGTLFDLA